MHFLVKLACVTYRALLKRKFEFYRISSEADVFLWRFRAVRGCRIDVGAGSMVRSRVVLERNGATFSVGDRAFIGHGLISVAQRVEIGNDVMISWGVSIADHNSHSLKFSERRADVEGWRRGFKDWTKIKTAEVRIQDKAWIGFNAIILKGVNIGEGAVVGAGSVVTKDVPAWTVVAGNPARVLREIPADER